MDLKELTEFLVKKLVTNPENISVTEKTNEKIITIIVMVPKDEIGKVIGYRGKTVNAIRTIVQASSYMNNLPKVKIEVEER